MENSSSRTPVSCAADVACNSSDDDVGVDAVDAAAADVVDDVTKWLGSSTDESTGEVSRYVSAADVAVCPDTGTGTAAATTELAYAAAALAVHETDADDDDAGDGAADVEQEDYCGMTKSRRSYCFSVAHRS